MTPGPADAFREVFGASPEVVAEAPGRVNLLGEHTDYNEGYVLPAPLPLTAQVAAARLRGQVDAYSANLHDRTHRAVDGPPAGHWTDYVAGCVWSLRAAGFDVPGVRVWVRSTVPLGSGLSSSAALEVAVMRALRELYRLPLDDVALARLAWRAEAEYVGVRCGIMDQMAASVGRPGEALFVDTRTLRWERVALPAGHRVLVVDSGVARRLADAGYNLRRAECERAARELGVRALRDLGLEDLPRVQALADPLRRRARHVVTENARVLDGVRALRAQAAAEFGRLMTASHGSLAEDFEVSTPEVDRVVDACLRHGALGARVTGAGFGGAVVALVPQPAVERVRDGLAADCPDARVVSELPEG